MNPFLTYSSLETVSITDIALMKTSTCGPVVRSVLIVTPDDSLSWLLGKTKNLREAPGKGVSGFKLNCKLNELCKSSHTF